VLVSVLWVVALLTVITLSYHHRARLEVQAARYSLDSSQAMLAARGAVERGLLELRNKSLLDQLAAQPGMPAGGPLVFLGQPWARGGELYGEDGLLEAGETFREDSVRYTIEDLERYVNINTATEALLENLPGISRPVARQINFRRSGADEGGVPSGAGRVPFQDIAELRGLHGIRDEDWFGGGKEGALLDLLTTLGDGRVNVNTAPFEVLRVLPGVDEAAAKTLVAMRTGADGEAGTADDRGWSDWDIFATDTGIHGDTLQSLKQLCKFDSSYFKIEGLATRRGGRIRSACAAVVHVTGDSGVATIIAWTEEPLGAQ
jgi:type II secretory pathway component PulK